MVATSLSEIEVQPVEAVAVVEVYALKQETREVELWGRLVDGAPEVGMQYALVPFDPDELTTLDRLMEDM